MRKRRKEEKEEDEEEEEKVEEGGGRVEEEEELRGGRGGGRRKCRREEGGSGGGGRLGGRRRKRRRSTSTKYVVVLNESAKKIYIQIHAESISCITIITVTRWSCQVYPYSFQFNYKRQNTFFLRLAATPTTNITRHEISVNKKSEKFFLSPNNMAPNP